VLFALSGWRGSSIRRVDVDGMNGYHQAAAAHIITSSSDAVQHESWGTMSLLALKLARLDSPKLTFTRVLRLAWS